MCLNNHLLNKYSDDAFLAGLFDDNVPTCKKAHIRPSILLNVSEDQAACQHWHQDTRSDKILSIILALEPGYFLDIVLEDKPFRVHLEVGEVLCFLDMIHRGTEAMGMRMHVRVELQERGESVEVESCFALRYIIVL